ncbi:MAG: hypothetical protein WC225_00825 [Acholeplasmataceae bacterium]|nr:hypothetical protein [Acholeplasmataceae bacterium]
MKKMNPVVRYFLKIISNTRTNIRDYGMYIALAVIFLVFSILTNGLFLGPINFTNLLNQTGYVAVLAVGMTLVIVTRQIDLSVGFLGAFLGAYIVVEVENLGTSVWYAIIVAILITVVIGFVKGILIARVNVPSFVVTLAGMFIFKGMLLLKTDSTTTPSSNNFFRTIGVGYLSDMKVGNFNLLTLIVGALAVITIVTLSIMKYRHNKKLELKQTELSMLITQIVVVVFIILFLTYNLAVYKGISYLVLITIMVVAIYHFFTTKTVLGRRIYAVGGNPEAAELSGINVYRIIIFVFVSMGVLTLIAGLMYVSMLRTANPNYGISWELYAIAATYIGGTSAQGGVGKVINAFVGAIVIMSIQNGMKLAGFPSNIEPIVLGGVLLLAVVFDIYTRNVRSIDLVGVSYAKQKYHDEFVEIKDKYIQAKQALKLADQTDNIKILELEFELTKAQGEYNQLKDRIRTAKEEDFLNVI